MEDVLLVVEVADSSLRYDREVKLPRYAAAGVPEAWIANLPGAAVEVHRDPASGDYRARAQYLPGDAIAPAAFPDLRLPVAAILGQPSVSAQ
jgi:Uma2 family endonuclease